MMFRRIGTTEGAHVPSGASGRRASRFVLTLAAAVALLARIDRQACRRIMEDRFSDRYLVNAYEQVYREMA